MAGIQTQPPFLQLPPALGPNTGVNSVSVVFATDATAPLPTGGATLAAQTSVQTPITPATATATAGLLLGAQYNSALPTYTNGQQGAVQITSKGILYGTLAGATGTAIGNSAVSGATYSNTTNTLSVQSFGLVYDASATTFKRTPGDDSGAISQPYAITSSRWTYAAAASGITNTTTAVTFIAAAGASVRNYVTGIQIAAEALGAATEVAIRDGAGGTVLWRTKIGTAGIINGISIDFNVPLKGTANTLLEVVTLTASVTGAVYFNAQGFQGA